MKYIKQKLDALHIVGISIRTTNLNGKSQNDITKLWDDFTTNNISKKISNKLSGDIYCLYTNYESDFSGEYTTFIGCRVSDINRQKKGLDSITISPDEYYKFISEGKLPDCVTSTWQYIWENDLPRSYHADFDIYGEDTIDYNNAKITTYISVKA